jgi:hypothetical protein
VEEVETQKYQQQHQKNPFEFCPPPNNILFVDDVDASQQRG